jgi:uncharacterized protein YejL (UPF0352 family)
LLAPAPSLVVLTKATAATILTLAFLPAMLANAPATILTHRLLSAMLAKAAAPTTWAQTPSLVMPTNAATLAFFAQAFLLAVIAKATAATILTLASLSAMLANAAAAGSITPAQFAPCLPFVVVRAKGRHAMKSHDEKALETIH